MRRHYLRLGLALATLLLVTLRLPEQPAPATPSTPRTALARLPLTFEPNGGQVDSAVRFLAHAPGGTLFFTPAEVVLALDDLTCRQDGEAAPESRPRTAAPAPPQTLRLQFVAAHAATLVGGHEGTGRVNYLHGDDPGAWTTDLPTYTGITYSGLYPGVDLQYAGAGGQLKGTYTVAAGADPTAIRWRYAGATGLTVDAAGSLHIRWAGAPLTEQAPLAWQLGADGMRVPVTARYSVAADGSIGFALGAYDRTQPLTLDPTLTYSTYLGGSDADEATGITLDSAGNVYVTGYTYSTNFPLSGAYQGSLAGAYDVFVTKLNAAGSALIYATYLGGSGTESGAAIAVDGAGNATVTGYTYSTNFPTLNAFQGANAGAPDGFLTRLNAAGSALVFSTYLGGGASDYGTGVAISGTGDMYLSGTTQSLNFPIANAFRNTNAGATDAFVSRFNAAGSALVYSTYLGGSGDDQALGVAVDSVGNAYLTGYTQSPNFPLNNALQPAYGGGTYDAFVSVLNTPGAALIYSTYLGGSGLDRAAAIAVDGTGNATVTGYTQSINFPTLNAYQPATAGATDAFLTKLNAIGSALVYSTYLGGSGDDEAQGIALSSTGAASLTGFTSSTNFPTMTPYQPANGGNYDAFLTTVNAAGSALSYSTYLGGSSADRGAAIAVDAAGGAYITGYSQSTNFPLAGPYQPANNGLLDAFVAKISDAPAVTPTPSPTPILAAWVAGASLPTSVVRGAGVVYLLPAVGDDPEHFHNRTRFEVIGGSSSATGAPQLQPYEYQPLTDTWTLKQAVFDDAQVTDMIAVVLTDGVGSRIYMVGGRAPNATSATNKVRIYDPIADVTPTVLTSDPWPALNTLPGGAAVYNNRLYIFGGYEVNVGTKFQIWEFDPLRTAGSRWQLKTASLPAAKAFIPVAALDAGGLYVVGGATYDAATGQLQDSSTAYRYDPVADTLTPIAALLRATSHTQAVEVAEELWVLGGGVSPPAPYNAVQIYNPGTNTWRYGPPFTQARRNAAIGVAEDHAVYMAGGDTILGATQSVEIYREGVAGSPSPTPTQCAVTFNDVPSSNIFYPYIRCLVCLGIVSGYPCGSPGEPCPGLYYRPNNQVTRGQLAKIVAQSAGFIDPVASTQQTFEDVPTGYSVWSSIERVSGHGIISGYPCGGVNEPCVPPLNRPYFRPGSNATRAQISKIVGISAGFQEAVPSAQQTFEDVPGTSTFWVYIERMAGRGVIGGYPCGSPGEPCVAPLNRPYFRPNNNATRGQISKITSLAFFPGCNPPSR